MTKQDLTPKQARFVEEYLIDLNATRAARAAGYSRKTAEVQGPRLLGNVRVAAAIAAAQDARSARTEITSDRVLKELETLTFSDLTHYTVDDDGEVVLADGAPKHAMRAIASIKRRITSRGEGKRREITREVEIRLWDKPGPLKLAGQHVGLFKEIGDKERPLHATTNVKFGGRWRPAERTT